MAITASVFCRGAGDSHQTHKSDSLRSNGYGIYIVNPTHGLKEKIITITSDNIIYHNTITLNEKYGIYIEYSLHNRILKNNFINNSGLKKSSKNQDAFFLLSRYNEWNGNFWNSPTSQPITIPGIYGPMIIWVPDFSNGFIFRERKYISIIKKRTLLDGRTY